MSIQTAAHSSLVPPDRDNKIFVKKKKLLKKCGKNEIPGAFEGLKLIIK
jgi:hypothetical protein